LLAIVIPYYKLTFFEDTLHSLANQTDQRFKVYIGDDASPENPTLLLKKYKNEFNFLYHRFEVNLGTVSLTKQWERCIDMTSDEEWIMILGDDDYLEYNIVEQFHKNINEIKNISNVIRFSSCKIDEKGQSISEVFLHPKQELSTNFLFRNTRSSMSEYIFKKKIILDIGFIELPLAWFADVLAMLEFSNFKDVYSINSAIVYVRITELSISGNRNNLKLKSKAKFGFYYYLLSKKIKYFNSSQIKSLKDRLNNCYLSDKGKFMLFLKITMFYLTNFLIKEYVLFLDKIVRSIINKK
jgi:glycosyltransferase involved in cell wall biosynthesis